MVKRTLLMKLLHCKRMKQKTISQYVDCSNTYHDNSTVQIKIERDDDDDATGLPDSCRVCLKPAFFPIFGDDINEDLSEQLSLIANISVSVNDEHPKHLCSECKSLLQGAILLRKTAEKTSMILQRHPKQENVLGIFNYEYDSHHDHYNEYEETQQKDEIHSCTICNLEFNSLNALTAHKRTQEHKDVKQKCTICDKEYSATYFKKHMTVHDGTAPFMCDVCGKSFVAKGHFQRHKETHGFKLPFHCHLCPYRGRFNASLTLHLRTHTGDKPYACTECPKRCISKSNLNKHMRTHNKTYNFWCDSCGKGFNSKRDLETHLRVDHTGLKEHICDICEKAFGHRKQMMKHQLKVHKRAKLKGGRMPTYLLLERKKELGESFE